MLLSYVDRFNAIVSLTSIPVLEAADSAINDERTEDMEFPEPLSLEASAAGLAEPVLLLLSLPLVAGSVAEEDEAYKSFNCFRIRHVYV